MNIFKRIFKISQAEAHSAVDKLENPIKLTEQGIRDLKVQLEQSLQAYAEVKALAIRSKTEISNHSQKAESYEAKAITLLQRANKGEIDTIEADKLATESLFKKEENINIVNIKKNELKKIETNLVDLESKIKSLKETIKKYENELKTLKARVTVSNATKTINKQMAKLDATSTISMLERMKDKIAQDEALAEAYGEIANESKSVDAEIDSALEKTKVSDATNELSILKDKLGLNKR